MSAYTHPKIDKILDACHDFTERDFADLALAAADQSGLNLTGQRILRAMLNADAPIPGEDDTGVGFGFYVSPTLADGGGS